jgi:hypothetical protein
VLAKAAESSIYKNAEIGKASAVAASPFAATASAFVKTMADKPA